MSGQMIKIDVEKIMDEIRQEIKEKGYTNDLLSFQDVEIESDAAKAEFDMNEMKNCVQAANMSARVEYYHQMIPHRGLKNIVKIVLRKILRFLLLPLLEEQNRYNADSVRTINQLTRYVEEQLQKNHEYEEEIRRLNNRVTDLEAIKEQN